MKRHTQEPGIRRWTGDDFIALQSESLEVLDSFFAQYGSCIIKGCEVNGTTITPGIVALSGVDEQSNAIFKVVRFAGAQNINTYPVYMTLRKTTHQRIYVDGLARPVVYEYDAELKTALPNAPHIVIDSDGGRSFVDALQDEEHRMITDDERTKWNDKPSKDYITTGLDKKVDKVEGKGLSTADFTTEEKAKLSHLGGEYDYIVDSDAKLNALDNNASATNVLIKKGIWTRRSHTSLTLNAVLKTIVFEEGAKLNLIATSHPEDIDSYCGMGWNDNNRNLHSIYGLNISAIGGYDCTGIHGASLYGTTNINVDGGSGDVTVVGCMKCNVYGETSINAVGNRGDATIKALDLCDVFGHTTITTDGYICYGFSTCNVSGISDVTMRASEYSYGFHNCNMNGVSMVKAGSSGGIFVGISNCKINATFNVRVDDQMVPRAIGVQSSEVFACGDVHLTATAEVTAFDTCFVYGRCTGTATIPSMFPVQDGFAIAFKNCKVYGGAVGIAGSHSHGYGFWGCSSVYGATARYCGTFGFYKCTGVQFCDIFEGAGFDVATCSYSPTYNVTNKVANTLNGGWNKV